MICLSGIFASEMFDDMLDNMDSRIFDGVMRQISILFEQAIRYRAEQANGYRIKSQTGVASIDE